MAICNICGKPVSSGVVVHRSCLPGWISVKDALPDRPINGSFDTYSNPLLFTDGICVYAGYCFASKRQSKPRWEGYDIDGLIDSGAYSDCTLPDDIEKVTHWMPLPKPPEVE